MAMTPRCFVVNEPMKYDHTLQQEVRMIDLKPAAEYGDLVFLLPPGRLPMDPTPTIQALQKGLEDYQPDDYLLLVGDPRAIAFAAAIAADKTDGRLRLLVWQRTHYIPVRANLFDFAEEGAAE